MLDRLAVPIMLMTSALAFLIAPCVTAAPPPVREVFGDIAVAAESLEGPANHGYSDLRVVLTNRGPAARLVTLTLPKMNYGFGRGEIVLRSATRTVEVGPGETVRASLLLPWFPEVSGQGLGIAIDGRDADRPLSLNLPSSSAGRGYGRFYGRRPVAGPDVQPLVLTGPKVRTAFAAAANDPTALGGGLPSHTMRAPLQFVALDSPAAFWPTNWLSYSRYDGIVLTGDDVRDLPPAAQLAVWQFVECGGVLLVLGKVELPPPWKYLQTNLSALSIHEAGFGVCFVSDKADYADWDATVWQTLRSCLTESGAPWRNLKSVSEAHTAFPVVEDVGVPVRGLFVLMIVFAIVIGPLNMVVLTRMRRRLWMLATVPLISFVTCAAVFGYMAAAEGWNGHLRTAGLTLLEESSHRATTLGWTGFYSPLTPGDGLRFSPDMELTLQAAPQDMHGGSTDCTIDWSREQHLARGWVTARVPSIFMVRKAEVRRERVVLHRGKDGKLSMVNGLGADIRRFWYRDEQGGLFTATDVPAGGLAVLANAPEPPSSKPDPRTAEPGPAPKGVRVGPKVAIPLPPVDPAPAKRVVEPQPPGPGDLRALFTSDWLSAQRRLGETPAQALQPRSYLAELDDAPFIEDGLRNAKSRKCHSLVIGMNKEPEKE
jgi:hypothetical protein